MDVAIVHAIAIATTNATAKAIANKTKKNATQPRTQNAPFSQKNYYRSRVLRFDYQVSQSGQQVTALSSGVLANLLLIGYLIDLVID